MKSCDGFWWLVDGVQEDGGLGDGLVPFFLGV